MASISCFSSSLRLSDDDPLLDEGRNRRLFMDGKRDRSGFLSREITDLPEDVMLLKTDGRLNVPKL